MLLDVGYPRPLTRNHVEHRLHQRLAGASQIEIRQKCESKQCHANSPPQLSERLPGVRLLQTLKPDVLSIFVLFFQSIHSAASGQGSNLLGGLCKWKAHENNVGEHTAD